VTGFPWCFALAALGDYTARDQGKTRVSHPLGENSTGNSSETTVSPVKTRALFTSLRAPPSATTSKFWGVSWHKGRRRWQGNYKDANGKNRGLGYFDTQEAAAHAVNAAIRRAGLAGKRKTNPVVDGQLVPRARKAKGHGRDASRKRRRDETATTPSTHARRPRRAVDYAATVG